MVDLREIRQFRDLRRQILFFRIAAGIVIFRLLIPWVKIPSLLGFIDRPSRKRALFQGEDLDRARLAWKYANFVVGRLGMKNPCLVRSLTLFHLFREKGRRVQIRFGVKRAGGVLEGHSWVLLNDGLFFEPEDPETNYTVTYFYPHESR